MPRLDNELKHIAAYIREEFSAADLGSFNIEIIINGQTDGSAGFSIVYKVDCPSCMTTSVRGRDISDCIAEYIRRKDRDKRQEIKLVSFDGGLPTRDEEEIL